MALARPKWGEIKISATQDTGAKERGKTLRIKGLAEAPPVYVLHGAGSRG
jgi:hypothetical protein